MFGGNRPQGFTIIEVIIFLAVSGLLFLSVLGLINNKQNTTYFSQGIHEFTSQIQSLANDVQIGTYNSDNNFSCNAFTSGGPPVIRIGSASQGSNFGCTFIGHVIQFGTSSSQTQYIVYTIVGRQFQANSTLPVTNLTEAQPITIGSASTPTFEATTVNLPPGLVISGVSYQDVSSGSAKNFDSLIGFFSSFPQINNGIVSSNSLSTDLIPVPSNPVPSSSSFITPGAAVKYVSEMRNKSSGIGTTVYGNNSYICVSPSCTIEDPTGGVEICLSYQGLKNTYAHIIIGGNAANNGATGNPLGVQLNEGKTC